MRSILEEELEHEAFLSRVLGQLPSGTPSSPVFKSWNHGSRPTDEGVFLMAVPGADAEQVIDAVMDVDHYVGNIEHVSECRSIEDARFTAPDAVRFYQKVSIPMLGAVHHELVLHRMGEHDGFTVAGWGILRDETDALSAKSGIRSDYNHGLWLVKDGVVGYALGSCPLRSDVGFLKWKALTKGADVAAKKVLGSNIDGMVAWSKKR